MNSASRELTLWLPEYAFDTHYKQEKYLRLREGHVKVFRAQPEVEIGFEPNWTIDPLKSQTWRLYYHGLTWLLAVAWEIDHGEDIESAQAYLRDVIRSYLRDNVFAEGTDEMAWDDHAAADRLTILSYLWLGYLGPASLVEREEIENAAGIHVQQLLEFYESERWIASNHGLFHSLALLNAALVFPDSKWAEKARRSGAEYLRDTVDAIIDRTEGISTEQSSHYHQFALRSLRSMREFLDANFPDLCEFVAGVTDKMVDFNLCIRGDRNAMPAIGDSRFADQIPSDCLTVEPGEAPSAHLEYIESGGRVGMPFEDLVVYPRTGLAVFREGEPPNAPSRALFVLHPERVGHGHFDALNITLHLSGQDVLIDSGGPYKYGDSLRFGYFAASRAHNVLLVDGAGHEAATEICDWRSTKGLHWVTARHRGYKERIVTRTAVWDPGQLLMVFDGVTGAGHSSRYDTLWHFSPGTKLLESQDGDGFSTVYERGDGVATSKMLATTEITSHVVEGLREPHPQGWVTEEMEEMRPAPVQIVSAQADWFQSVTVFGEWVNHVRIERSEDGLCVDTGDARIVVDSVQGLRVA
ncbi:MAG: heparinase II/III family protein [Actinomycetota bacterium]